MKKRIIILLIAMLGAFVVSGCGTTEESVPVNSSNGENVDNEAPAEGNEDTGAEENVLEILQTNVSVDAGDAEALFTISLKNTSDENVKLTFTSGQRYEIVVSDASNKEVYRYSIDKSFIQAIEEIEVKPGEEKTWQEAWNYTSNDGARLPAGDYNVNALVVASQFDEITLSKEELHAESSFTIPEGNTAFRNIQVMGENGEYVVTGEARVFEGSFFYSVEDGHDYVVPETVKLADAGAPTWSAFEIKLSIPKDKLPLNGALTVQLYERSPKDGSISNSYQALLQQFQ